MGIMDKIFGKAPEAAAPVQQAPMQVLPGNIPAAPAVVSNPNNPTAPAIAEASPATGLDAYADLWKNDPANAPKAPEPMFNVDPAKLAAAAKNNDFTKAVTPEMMAAISAGGEGAIAATLAAMNAMSQKGFADSVHATSKIVEQALEKQAAQFEAKLPGFIKNQNLSDNLRDTNPIFKHAAASPILEVLRNQVAQKFPNATAAEQAEMANKYLVSFAEAANPPKQTAAQKSAANETDWDSFL